MNRIKNNQVESLIVTLKTLAITKERPLWKRVAVELSKPTRHKRELNVYKLERYAKDGEVIVVPGKVLGTGNLSKKITVAALQFSDSARSKIQSNKGEVLSIKELMEKHPDGKGIRIMG